MLKNIKDEFILLANSSRFIGIFELTYKLVAIAVIYPLILFLITICMKAEGINYLTNEYIENTLKNPLALCLLFVAITLFVMYCTFEMAFLAVCFEAKRRDYSDATVVDVSYNAFREYKRSFKFRSIPISIFYFIAIIASNITVGWHLIASETTTNMFRMYVLRNRLPVKIGLVVAVVIIYAFVVLGIYCMNISIMEGKNFRQSFKKSVSIVKKHPLGTISTLVLYNVFVFAVVAIAFVLFAVLLIAGVKILDMAYIGNALFLSALKTARVIVKCVLSCVAIPMSFSAISHAYYKFSDTEDITFEYEDINEGSEKKRRAIYLTVLGIAAAIDIFYVCMVFVKNPFENVALFHETKITAHRGASTEAPENTVAAIKKSIEDLTDCIEIDVQLTKDGQLVLMHDSSTYRTTGVDAKIGDMTYMELRQLDAGSWYSEEYEGEKIPSLWEVLQLVKGKADLNIELKPDDNGSAMASEVVRLIEKAGMVDSCVITSFDYDALMKVKEKNPNIKVGYILSIAMGEFYDMSGVDFFSVNATFLSKRTVDAIHNSGKQVYAWTVNSNTSIKNLTNKGVDNIITDKPVLAREVIYSRDTSDTLVNMLKYVFNR